VVALNPAGAAPGSDTSDFADSAAIASQLDLLISVDTALGVPCWVLLPACKTD
jgi:hypothetical protein